MRTPAGLPALVVPLLLAAMLAWAVPAAAQEPTQLVVVETASVRAAPDAAVLDASVRRSAASTPVARRRVERQVRRILTRLERIGVPAEAIRTDSFESFTERTRKRRVAYFARGIRVELDDLSKLEAVVGAMGGSLSGGPQFIVSDPTDERAAATAIALQRARARADAAAAQLGLRVTATLKVDLNPELGYDSDLIAASGGQDDEESSGGSGGGVTIERGRNQIGVARRRGLRAPALTNPWVVDIMHVLGRQRTRSAMQGYVSTSPASS